MFHLGQFSSFKQLLVSSNLQNVWCTVMESATSPMDFIKPYKDAGFTALIWKNPTGSEDSRQMEFARRLEEKGFKVQTLAIPQPPPGYAAPLYYPDLTFTILNPSAADAILNLTSGFLEETYQGAAKVTAKIDVVLDQRVVSAEVNGSSTDVGKTIKNIQKIEKLASSNLMVVVADQELTKVPQRFCSKCGVPMPAQSEYCYHCGEKQQ